MKLEELFSRLSRDELSNLSIGNEGRGYIKEEDVPKLVAYVNDGLLQLFSRFVLNEKQLLIEMVRHITNYHLIPKYAESTGAMVDWPYIKDLPDEPFKGDVIRILEVHDSLGRKLPLNDKEDPNSLFTPKPLMLQVPRPLAGQSLAVLYQARHEPLDDEDLEQEINLPFTLEGALQSYVAYKVYNNMNGQENTLKAQEHRANYESICLGIQERDLVNETFSTSHDKLHNRGFV